MSDHLGHEPTRLITDEEFLRQLSWLRRTRHFLIAEGVAPTTNACSEAPFSLGRLNLIRGPRPRVFFQERGSSPALEDWSLLEQKQDGLQRFFNAELQHRFRLQATREIITLAPILLLLVVFGALFLAIAAPDDFIVSAAAWRFVAYLAWTSSLGGLGAIGFLAVNSLAIQNDATFDMSNPGLVTMRIVLGALFGSIVSLPFCFPYFKEFTIWVLSGGDLATGHGMFLLVPFLLGFSTSLVMAVLNRIVGGIETMFGIQRSSTIGATRTADGRPATSNVRAGPAAPAPRPEEGIRHHPPAADG